MKFISRRSYPLLSLCVYAALSSAAPPSTSPYFQDAQTSNVQDATSKSIGQVNMITCIMHAMRPEALVNKPSYNALVDENKCDQEKRSSTSTVQAPSYMTSTLSVTRTSNTDPMRSKIWIDQDEDGGHGTIFVNLSATAAPTATNPYGSFRLDFCGKGDGQNDCMMNGYMQGSDTGLRYYETEQQDNGLRTTALQLNTTGSTSGSGQVASTGGDDAGAYTFAYNSSLFLRSDGNTTECFSRDASDPDTGFSVWRYGLYDATTGERVVRNSGFPIEYTTGGVTYHGFLGYGGLSLPPDVMNGLSSGTTIQKVDYGNGNAPTKTDYTVVKAAGKLTKYTRNTRKLNEIDKIRFTTFLGNDASTFFSGAQANTQYEMYWDDAAGVFKVSGVMNCSGNNGCQTQGVSSDISIAASKWSSMGGIQGWSNSLGGEMYIGLAGVSGAVTSTSITVAYRTQDLVYPAQMANIPTLYCVRDCPTASSVEAYFAQGSQLQWPYVTATANNWQPTAVGDVVTYHTDANAALLKDSTNQAVTYTNADGYNQRPQYQYGIRSGRLFPTLAAAECSAGSGTYCDNKVNDLDVYYQWETGANSFSQFAAVKDSSGTFVHFDAPLLVNYTVPNGAAYGEYAGTSLVLQYGGYGDLWGVPGYCVSPTTNAVVQCGENTRYVPSFQIPFDTVNGVATGPGNTTYYIKWLDREIRFANKSPGVCSAASLTLPSNITLPTASNLKDPGNANSDIFIGVRPTVNEAPRVIHGDVKF